MQLGHCLYNMLIRLRVSNDGLISISVRLRCSTCDVTVAMPRKNEKKVSAEAHHEQEQPRAPAEVCLYPLY